METLNSQTCDANPIYTIYLLYEYSASARKLYLEYNTDEIQAKLKVI